MIAHKYKISNFWLPPELWRECLRWATLPPSGRLPLHNPPTCLDTWPLSILYDISSLYEGPDICYFYEQSALYPMKRGLPLVCKLWAALSTEFLYECIALEMKMWTCAPLYQLLVTLQHPNKGPDLARFVKRIDIRSQISPLPDVFISLFSLVSELRVLRFWKGYLVPLCIDQPALGKLNALAIYSGAVALINTPSSNSCPSWKTLTIHVDVWVPTSAPEPLPTLNQPMLHLKDLTLIFHAYGSSRLLLLSLSRLQGWALPALTHLSFHLCGTGNIRALKEVVDAFGKQLEFFALTCDGEGWDNAKSWFCEMLAAVPNIKELVFYPRPYDNISFDQLPPAKYVNVEVVGLPVGIRYADTEDLSWYTRLCTQAFPSLRIVRITGRLVPPNPEKTPRSYNQFWVRRAAIDLRSKGIRLEDRHGRDLWQDLGTAADEKGDGHEVSVPCSDEAVS